MIWAPGLGADWRSLRCGTFPVVARGGWWSATQRRTGWSSSWARMEGRVVELRGAEKNGERRRDGEVTITIVTITIIIVLTMMARLGGRGRGRGRTQLVAREAFLQVGPDVGPDEDHDVDHLLSLSSQRWTYLGWTVAMAPLRSHKCPVYMWAKITLIMMLIWRFLAAMATLYLPLIDWLTDFHFSISDDLTLTITLTLTMTLT